MLEDFDPVRYAVIEDKNPREIIMLRGSGCQWRRCRFCDYHLDYDPNPQQNFALNQSILSRVRGVYEVLEVINSGSFVDLDSKTMQALEMVCHLKNIRKIHFECHWQHRKQVASFKERWQALGIQAILKVGVETFDWRFRESYLEKGMGSASAPEIAHYFDEVCLLFGIPGQSVESMRKDLQIGLAYFQRVCVNVMQANTRKILPDPGVIEAFIQEILPYYQEDKRVDILLENTAFGVGGGIHAQ